MSTFHAGALLCGYYAAHSPPQPVTCLFTFALPTLLLLPRATLASLPRVGMQGSSRRTTTTRVGEPSQATLTVLHSGVLYSHFLEVDRDGNECTEARRAEGECYGGAARIKAQMNASSNALTLFTGDVYRGHIWFRIRGEPMVVEIMNQLAFDVMSLGISEFYNGPRGLKHLFANLSVSTDIVLCNADFSHDLELTALPNLPKRSVVKQKGNLRVGVIGFIHEEVRVNAQPGPTITFTPPEECLREEAKRLRSEAVNVIIALGGGNPELDRQLAERVQEVNAFVVSYRDRFAYPTTLENNLRKAPDLDYPIRVERGNGTGYIFVATTHYQYLGNFHITVRPSDMTVLTATGMPIFLDHVIPEDGATLNLTTSIRDAIEPEAMTVIGSTKVLIVNSPGECTTGECNGGNLFADAVFDFFSNAPVAGVWSQVNAVVVHAGSFVKNFDERLNGGELRLMDLFDMYPFNDPYVLITMQGDTLRQMMEHSMDTEAGHPQKFLQVSGMRVVFNRYGPVGSRVRQLSILCTACRTPSYERVIAIQWYTVAMPRFIAGGGEDYDFSRVPRGYKVDSNITDGRILQEYLKKHSPLMPMLDGRISFTSGAPRTASLAVLGALSRAACVGFPLLFGGAYISMMKR